MEALSYVEPDDPPLISQNDITAYDAQTHAIELTASAFSRVNQMVNPVNGTSFLVCVDASPVYWGALWSPYSSLSFSGVVIQIPPVAEKPNTIRLELGYPSPSVYQGQDPRDNGTVLEALDKDGKLINKPWPTCDCLYDKGSMLRWPVIESTANCLTIPDYIPGFFPPYVLSHSVNNPGSPVLVLFLPQCEQSPDIVCWSAQACVSVKTVATANMWYRWALQVSLVQPALVVPAASTSSVTSPGGFVRNSLLV